MQRLNNGYTSIEQMNQLLNSTKGSSKSSDASSTVNSGFSFEDVLKQTESESLKFSKHASDRLETRNINLSDEQKTRLEEGTTKARAKGIQESLVMVDDLAFIVNVKNNTVVTAVSDLKDSVFTNIDGAVIS